MLFRSMLDIDFEQLRGGFQRYAGVGAAVGASLLIELALTIGGWQLAPHAEVIRLTPTPSNMSNTEALGRVLYTDYIFLFQTAGLVLLVAMIGAIVLTLRERKTSRHQSIRLQTSRDISATLEVVNLSLGAGVTASGGIRRPIQTEPEEELEDEPEPAHDHHH